jgi:hypothetical protein
LAEIPEFLDDEWTDIVERLTLYAESKMRKLYWRGVSMNKGGGLPGGVCPADLVSEGITDWLEGKRIWNREGYPELFQFLKATVDSKVNHLAELLENKLTRRIDTPDGQPGPAYRVPGREPLPDVIVAEKEELETFKASIIEAIDGDGMARDVFECLEAEYEKPSEMAELLSTSLTEVNNAQKRLRRVADKVCAKLGRTKR